MAGAAVRESLTFAGRPGQVREACAFVARVPGPAHPCLDVAVLLASEVAASSVRRSGSAAPGGSGHVTVALGAVACWPGSLIVPRTACRCRALRARRRRAAGGLWLVEDLAASGARSGAADGQRPGSRLRHG